MADIVTACYISAGCNRVPNSVHWGNNGYICYASSRSVVLYDLKNCPEPGQVRQTLISHHDRVNAVRWIRKQNSAAETELVSVSSDKTAVVWQLTHDWTFEPVCILTGHENVVNCVDAIYIPISGDSICNRTLIATCSADSSIRIWQRRKEGESFTCFQVLAFSSSYALSLAFAILPGTLAPLLACGTSENKIDIFAEVNGQFIKLHSLRGHEDWIRGLEFTYDDAGDILLASCSQDSFIRIWKISPRTDYVNNKNQSVKWLSIGEEIKLKENIISVKYKETIFNYAVSLDSVLAGHDDWIYAVHWQMPEHKDDNKHQPMRLLSASMDKTMILWAPHSSSGVWLEQVRVGEVGGNTLGFYGCQFSPNGQSILAHGYQGSFHLWHFNLELNMWEPGVTVSGHFDCVEDIAWDPEGVYLLSASADQTTRLHAPWVRKACETTWHEIARPQIHGYNIQCITAITQHKFASGADEKVIRAFEAPKNFVENCGHLCKIDISKILKAKNSNLPEGASVPALGLSNKAVYENSETSFYNDHDLQPHPNEQFKELYFQTVALSMPPAEEHLLQNTLWPEIHKLYGHGFEIFCIASNHEGTILASACKASKEEHANIILWDCFSWRLIGRLGGHSLTVTQLAFSPNDRFLLSVSRDRTWCLFRRQDDAVPYHRVAFSDKNNKELHSRIIWSCAWSHDSKYFITASRDKKVIMWQVDPDDYSTDSSLGCVRAYSVPFELKDSVTAVDIAPVLSRDDRYIVAAGLENGQIFLFQWTNNTNQTKDCWILNAVVNNNIGHHLCVKRLQFQGQVVVAGGDHMIHLASCGADFSVRIFNINLNQL